MKASFRGVSRSRWAAIGAAIAVSLGAGGLFIARAAGPSAPSSFVAIDPVRILDTRSGVGLSGTFAHDVGRDLQVTGTVPVVLPNGTTGSGSPVPAGSTAIVATVTVVAPTAKGFVSVRPGGSTGLPTTSNLNINAAGQVYPTSVTVALSAGGAINIWYHGVAGATTQVLVDIVGYHRAAASPWGAVPSGQTVVGEGSYDITSSVIAGDDVITISLPARAPVALTSANVNFAPDGRTATSDDDAACTGSSTAPTAPAGKVCIYIQTLSNVVSAVGDGSPNLPTSVFRIRVITGTVATDTYLLYTWAYTAP